MRHQPSRAFGNKAADEENDKSHDAAQREGETPSDGDGKNVWVEHDERSERAQCRADPETAVDRKRREAAPPGGDQLIDRGIDRGIFAADASASQYTEGRKGPEIPGKSGRQCRHEIDAEGHQEKPLAAKAIGEIAKQ